jgi:putative restriction endonuclease
MEHDLQKEDGSTNKGKFGRSARSITQQEYEQIVALGFKDGKPLLKPDVSAPPEEPVVLVDRPIVEQLKRAVFRDYKFCQHVQEAYSSRCAMTGLSMIDRRGYLEVEAAHIRPAGGGHNGPDSVRNGLALTRTIHWLFDHGFLFVEDDNTITQRPGIPEKVTALLNPDRKLLIPEDISQRPHPLFLRYHREELFRP